jgi:ferredoxin-NADP reductase
VLSSPDGRGGAREIHERVRAGGLVPVRGPRNRFPLVDAPGYVFVAGGIGITPMLPMARAVATRGADWQLHYTGRTKETMAFADEALDLDPARVHLVPSATHGRLDVLALLATAPPASAVYCCGPGALVQAVADALDDPGRLHVERFQAARTAAPDPAATRFDVELARTGAVLAVPADRSVLDVVRAAVPGVAASCGEGICGTCEVRVLGGVPDHRDHVLGADERARGETMMICVSRAVTPTLVLDL